MITTNLPRTFSDEARKSRVTLGPSVQQAVLVKVVTEILQIIHVRLNTTALPDDLHVLNYITLSNSGNGTWTSNRC
jgi:hypothetical protein